MPLVLSGTDGVSGVDGTASNPSYEGTDSNTGIFFPAADTVAIGTGGTEALRVNSSQNVGVGTTSPGKKLDVSGDIRTSSTFIVTSNGTGSITDGANTYVGLSSSQLTLRTDTAIPIVALTNGTERARITSGGIFTMQSSTANGVYIQSGSEVTLASNATITITSATAGACVILVYDVGSGEGGMFWANYIAVVTKVVGDGSATDAGAGIAVYKSAASHTTTIKNRYAISKNFRIAVYSAQANP